jgi:hypothetical protein
MNICFVIDVNYIRKCIVYGVSQSKKKLFICHYLIKYSSDDFKKKAKVLDTFYTDKKYFIKGVSGFQSLM